MNKNIDVLNKLVSKISINFLIILFTVITIGMLCINSVYLYIDTASFKANNVFNYLGIIISIFGFLILILLEKALSLKIKKNKYINFIIFLIYFITEIIYIKLVPIKPFSDMFFVTEIALSDFQNEIQYLQHYPNNLPISIIFNLIFRITQYDVIYIKIFNIICNMTTIYFTYRIYENIYKKKNNIVILLGIFSISTFLYVNNAYNDIIFTALTTIILYLVTKEKQSRIDIFIISILAFLQFIVRPVGIILIIAVCMYYILKNKNIKNIVILLSIFLICDIMHSQLEKVIIPKSDEIQQYPIWSFIQMGINEKEFGFQDGSHSTEWTFGDVKNRIQELGPQRLLKLLCKKQYWLWTEGTYQVERYAFGTGAPEQFSYTTTVTNMIYDVDNSKARKALEYLMKGQYFILIVLSLIDLIIKDKDETIKNKKDILLYTIIGFFCFYTVWEIKSRYIYCLYPIFLILSTQGTEKIINLLKKKGEQNGKI